MRRIAGTPSNRKLVFVAGQIKKWQGGLVGQNIDVLRSQVIESRNYLFNAAGIKVALFD